MSANSQGAVANAVPEYAAFGMPFLFSSPAAAFKLLDGPLGKELADKSAEKGLVLLGTWDNGIRQMTNSKRPIGKVEDSQGFRHHREYRHHAHLRIRVRCLRAGVREARTPIFARTALPAM